ncbi:hypothetical protein EDC01DRAFT_431476 [Geopyxis carbonaria]|nr:hypothetical protein EDC01DRAFT_431476 [Geopyxis carbonaria]
MSLRKQSGRTKAKQHHACTRQLRPEGIALSSFISASIKSTSRDRSPQVPTSSLLTALDHAACTALPRHLKCFPTLSRSTVYILVLFCFVLFCFISASATARERGWMSPWYPGRDSRAASKFPSVWNSRAVYPGRTSWSGGAARGGGLPKPFDLHLHAATSDTYVRVGMKGVGAMLAAIAILGALWRCVGETRFGARNMSNQCVSTLHPTVDVRLSSGSLQHTHPDPAYRPAQYRVALSARIAIGANPPSIRPDFLRTLAAPGC